MCRGYIYDFIYMREREAVYMCRGYIYMRERERERERGGERDGERERANIPNLVKPPTQHSKRSIFDL